MSNNLHNDHFTSTRSHQTLVMISWAHLSEEVASLYNFLSVCLWIQFSSDDQIGCSWIGASQDVELQWSVYLRYVCVSAEQCTVGDEGVIVDLRSQPDRVDKYQVSNLQPCTSHHAYHSNNFGSRCFCFRAAQQGAKLTFECSCKIRWLGLPGLNTYFL